MSSKDQQPPTSSPPPIPVIDYEGSGYRHDFWEGTGREYEDTVERIALARLLPQGGGRIAELGAGFGRLADLYLGYEQILLFDYSRTLLADAVEEWGQDERFVFVAGNLYQLPFATGILDALVMVRVMHHLADVPIALAQIERTLHAESVAVLEYANKRNLKAIGRWVLRRQEWSPFATEPIEFVELNYDFHPRWMESRLRKAGLVRKEQYAISHFRLPLIKQFVPTRVLVGWEQHLFAASGQIPLAPSVLVQVQPAQKRRRSAASTLPSAVADLFRCPHCTTEGLVRTADDRVVCPGCKRTYQRQNQIWDFKNAVNA